MVTTALYKFTAEDGSSCHGGTGRWTLGEWRSVSGPLVPCKNGLHLCRVGDLMFWLGPALWRTETDGELVEAADKVVVRTARITRRVEEWHNRSARLFAADCAEHVLPLFEAYSAGDDRPRKAIEAARAFANGEIPLHQLTSARAEAEDAVRRRPPGTVWTGAWEAAGDAAKAAALAGARTAASAAAAAAASAAAWEAAGAYAGATAWGTAEDAEREWQAAHLCELLGINR